MASRDSLKLRCSIAAILVAKNSECVMVIEIGTKVTKTEALHTSSKTPTTCHNTEFKRDAAISFKSHHHLPAQSYLPVPYHASRDRKMEDDTGGHVRHDGR